MKIMRVRLFLLLTFLIFLTACGRHETFKDLDAYLAKMDQTAKAVPSPKNKNIMPQVASVVYQKESLRTPFEETDKVDDNGSANALNSAPIQRYPLNLLRFVGIVTQNSHEWAYIITPDNKLYQVTIGDEIGNHHGKITKIDANKVEVTEQSATDEEGAQRIVTLQLKEEAANGQTQ